MQIYLPIAEVSIDALLLVGLGMAAGFLSGVFGVGGGFLLTPLLIFVGIPPAVAVASGTNQIVASSVSGAVTQWRRGNVDLRMGLLLLAAGVIGAIIGATLFRLLQRAGQIDLFIQFGYIVLLGIVGLLMVVESIRGLLRRKGQTAVPRKRHVHYWVHRWPLRVRFRHSKLYISAIPPFLIGVGVGALTALIGVGGGFIMVPVMIYLFGMPTLVVVGTSQFQIVAVTAVTTLLLALTTQTVDVVLAALLIVGGVVGTQLGTRAGAKLKGEQLRGLLALLMLGMALRLAYELVAVPADVYSIGFGRR
jgi:uncharacterized membrane protein YfcA